MIGKRLSSKGNLIKRPGRSRQGNMLVFITAVTLAIIVVIGLFSLGFIRLMGSNNEQRTAIESAALAAARDLSSIVVNTPEYGMVSISDSAPIGTATSAGDNYYTPVHGINTVIGTIRLDMLIAKQLGDANLQAIIAVDLANALKAQNALATELQKSIVKGYAAKDANGNSIDVYGDAETAYKQNQIRMTGTSNYVTGSLKLSLGAVNGGTLTNIPVPSNPAWAILPASAQQNGKYLSYQSMPVGTSDFVLAGIGDSIKLVDSTKFTPTVAGLPYQVATIVRAEADQHVNDPKDPSGYTVHAAACAQPANIIDPKPAPGALTFSFPDGMPPEMVQPGSMLTYGNFNLNSVTCSYQYSQGGDYPFPMGGATMQDRNWEFDPLSQNPGNVFRKSLYDWWRRAGTKLDMASAIAMLNDPAFKFQAAVPATVAWKTQATIGSPIVYTLGQIPNGIMHIYRVQPSTGLISYQNKQIDPIPYLVSGENQVYSESVSAITGSAVPIVTMGPFSFTPELKLLNKITLTQSYDLYIRDQVYQPGTNLGGRHAGEPMDNVDTALLPGQKDLGGGGVGAYSYIASKGTGKPPVIANQSDFAEGAGFPASYYRQYSVGSGIRPTYQTNGTAIDIRFRRQVITAPISKSGKTNQNGHVGEKFSIFPPPSAPIPADPAADGDGLGDVTGGDSW